MQDKKKQSKRDQDEEQVDDLPVAKKDVEEDEPGYDVDDFLAEIDDVLETNAEDFVKSFIQKGGQ